MFDLGGINWLAVAVSVVAAQVLGFLWYGPLFGKQWMTAMGTTREELQEEGPGLAIIVGVVGSVLNALGIALILTTADTPDVVNGIKVGLLTSIGFAAAAVVTNAMFEGRRPMLMCLYAAYLVISITMMGAILGAW